MLLLGATLLAYGPALAGSFLWNDSDYVTAPALRSWSGLARIWFEVGAVQQYYPVLHTAFWIEHRLWGDGVVGYHLANVLLHVASACLLALVLQRLGPPPAGSVASNCPSGVAWTWLAAFLFALHPVCVESVAWISEEKNTLSTAFYLAAALAYLRFEEQRSLRSYLLATGLFLLALLSKSVAATLPAALLVLRWWRTGEIEWRRDVRPLLPWCGLGAALGLFTAWVEYRYVGAQGATFALTFAQRFLIAGRTFWFYLGKLLWPHPLVFIYPRWEVNAGALWQYLFPLAALVLLGALWRLRRRSRAPLAALLFFAGSLFPVLGFFNVYAFTFSFVADHFQYLPCLGVVALAAGGWGWLGRALRPPAPRVLGALAAGVLLLLGILTWRQSRSYRDVPAFYGAILAKNPAAWMAHTNLAAWLAEAGRTDEARSHYREALRLRPDDLAARSNVGVLLADQGKFAEAIAQFRALLAVEPRYASAHRSLANALLRSGQSDEALAEYETALRLSPRDAPAWNDYGTALVALGRLPEAVARFEEALRLDSSLAAAHDNLGGALVRLGRPEDGMRELEAALRLEPNRGATRSNLGMALAQTGQLAAALEQLQMAVRSQPDLEEARNNLGNVLLALGRIPEAGEQFAAALRINPHSAQAYNNLGNVAVQSGRLAEAVDYYQGALRITPEYFESQLNLGVALLRLGRYAESRDHFQAALRLDPSNATARRGLDRAEVRLRSR